MDPIENAQVWFKVIALDAGIAQLVCRIISAFYLDISMDKHKHVEDHAVTWFTHWENLQDGKISEPP